MTGWRIGYAGGPSRADQGDRTRSSRQQTSGNPSSISQWAAVEALNGHAGLHRGESAARSSSKRRDLVVSMLNQAKGIVLPDARKAPSTSIPSMRRHVIGKTTAGGKRLATDEDFAMALRGRARASRSCRARPSASVTLFPHLLRGIDRSADLRLREDPEVLRRAALSLIPSEHKSPPPHRGGFFVEPSRDMPRPMSKWVAPGPLFVTIPGDTAPLAGMSNTRAAA
jgi:hypothetical protein